MKKIILCIAALTCLYSTVEAQKKEKVKKYKEIFYKDVSVEGDDMTIIATNGLSNKEMTKFKLKIINKTNDVILYKPEESVIKVGEKEAKPKEKWLTVYPGDSDFRVVNFDGTDYLAPYNYIFSGAYKISTDGKGIDAPDFQLPASQNEFTAGPFTCTMASLTKESDKTEVKFECKYVGDKIGVIQANRSAIKLPDGTEIANEKTKAHPVILTKGKIEKVTFKWNRMQGGKSQDMQKINLIILFRNTFSEVDAEKLKDESLQFVIDEALSK